MVDSPKGRSDKQQQKANRKNPIKKCKKGRKARVKILCKPIHVLWMVGLTILFKKVGHLRNLLFSSNSFFRIICCCVDGGVALKLFILKVLQNLPAVEPESKQIKLPIVELKSKRKGNE
jgi:hypothetical protein